MCLVVVVAICAPAWADTAASRFPTLPIPRGPDWLLQPDPRKSPLPRLVQLDPATISLSNGLLARTFVTTPFFATWDVATLKGSALRGLSAEATVTLDKTTYNIGGAYPVLPDGTPCPLPVGVGPPNNCPTSFFNRSIEYAANKSAFVYSAHWTSTPTAPFPWTPARHAPDMPWPPLGLRLSINFTAPATALPEHQHVVVTVHYEMYSGAPILSKWLEVALPGPTASKKAEEQRDLVDAAPSHSPGNVDHHEPAKHSVVGVPPDQQGPVCLQPCASVLPPSSWESRWLLTSGPTAIQMAGPQSLCLTIVAGTAAHSFNDQLDVAPCNLADPLQRWNFSATTGQISTLATPGAIKALNRSLLCPGLPSQPCFIDINNHQTDAGTTLQMASGDAAEFKLAASATPTQIELLSYGSAGKQCVWHTPLPPPPPSPAPPPPKPVCSPGTCVVLAHADVEVLRLNAPWAPAGISQFLPGMVDYDTYGGPSNNGLLDVHPSQGLRHGSVVTWGVDPTYDPDYSGNDGSIQPMVTVGYAPASAYGGPGARVRAGAGGFSTFRALELWADSVEPERLGLSLRKRTRLLAPQTSEAPLFLHLTDISLAGVKNAVDQMAAVGGFDMLIFSFGSGFQLENTSPSYMASVKESIDYAHSKGIEVGGYDLISLSRGGTGYDNIDPATGQPLSDACFASGWNRHLLNTTLEFIAATGLSMVETDGPYGGTPCGSTDHDHYGADDSVTMQWQNQAAFYAELRSRGIFIHAPDDYLFAGGANKYCGWYSEMQFSLPRWQWISTSHQEVFDHTYSETPTQTWMFAPLVDYHSGGPPAALEPFSENIVAWNFTLATYIGAGVGACYRGNELYDSPPVQAMVQMWTQFWVQYRTILTQDIIHVRRPDMQSIDSILHVSANKTDEVAGLAMFYNPSLAHQNATFDLNLYYTGETDSVAVTIEEGPTQTVALARDYTVPVSIALGPQQVSYAVFRRIAH